MTSEEIVKCLQECSDHLKKAASDIESVPAKEIGPVFYEIDHLARKVDILVKFTSELAENEENAI